MIQAEHARALIGGLAMAMMSLVPVLVRAQDRGDALAGKEMATT
jgi:hypothetical protein